MPTTFDDLQNAMRQTFGVELDSALPWDPNDIDSWALWSLVSDAYGKVDHVDARSFVKASGSMLQAVDNIWPVVSCFHERYERIKVAHREYIERAQTINVVLPLPDLDPLL